MFVDWLEFIPQHSLRICISKMYLLKSIQALFLNRGRSLQISGLRLPISELWRVRLRQWEGTLNEITFQNQGTT